MTGFDRVSPTDLIGLCVLASNLLGSDPAIVLHGGGNTSVKQVVDVDGSPTEIVHVKSSGHDLATIGPRGFAPVRRDALLELVARDTLDDRDMAAAFRAASIDPDSATASIEAIPHALLPHRFVLHSHADAVVTLTDSPLTDAELSDVFGESVAILPYVRPGFDLAKVVAKTLKGTPPAAQLRGLVLRNHGLFTFDDDAERAYADHLALIERAHSRIRQARLSQPRKPAGIRLAPLTDADLDEYSGFRQALCETAGFAVLVRRDSDNLVEEFLSQDYLRRATEHGTATMEHVIHIKPFPLVGTDVRAYADRYRERFARLTDGTLRPLDLAPRIVLDSRWGLLSVGRTQAEVRRVRDIYRHTMAVIMDSESLGGFRSLTERELFDIEYWELEQAKLLSTKSFPPLTGMVAVLDGPGGHHDQAWLTLAVGDGLAKLGAVIVLTGSERSAVAQYGGVDMVVSIGREPSRSRARPIGVRADGSHITVTAGIQSRVVATGALLDGDDLDPLCAALQRAAGLPCPQPG
ncbi:class II aldolase/adducin family protein [Mycobacterium sp. 236(2023)]|uniref:class II aldolase/adducin family protein n=1 Tax=Mycobacterium sp. 236(2023) TaxID=3038163 RepID=UPI0024156A49|nr:class II aldolase/adducin family protein [Mycobacterium sp. 236(2023)]MDG4667130.1 class II aldolase/adducin family protein [Mycobacterium sp. 236(2023)]